VRAVMAGLLAGAALACGDDQPTAAIPATYDVVFHASGAPVGAVLFLVQGGAVDTVEGTGYYTASAPFSGVATQILVAGPTLDGAIARVVVSDPRLTYQAVAREVAVSGSHNLWPVDSVTMTLVPARR
jgi:hypothetical protein